MTAPSSTCSDRCSSALEEDFNARLVRAALSYVACSRNGLFEPELQALVRHLPGALDLLPVLRQLRAYLLNRGGLIDFYHTGLRKAVGKHFLDRELDRPKGTRFAGGVFPRCPGCQQGGTGIDLALRAGNGV